MRRSMNSASRWPPSVVTSSPTMTSTAGRGRAAIDRAGERGIDPLVVGDGDDVEVAARGDVLEDLDDVGDAVRGDACGCAGRRGRSRSAVMRHRLAGSGRRRAPRRVPSRLEVRPDREETAHHCSGASAMTRSKARAIGAVVAVTRSRRVPSAGTSTRSSAPGSGRGRSAARRRRRPARRSRSPARPGPAAARAGAPNSSVSVPPPVRSRSPTSPTLVPSRSAGGSSRRASRRPTIGRRPRRGCARTSPGGPGRRGSPSAPTAPPTRDREEQRRQLDRAEVQADEDRRPPPA